MRYWEQPKDEHIVYEALTAISSGRVVKKRNVYKCFSSSANKFYTITFDFENMSSMSDDNMAYYREEVSYPMLAVLLLEEKIFYNKEYLNYFKNIPWKDINQKNRNNYMQSVEQFLGKLESKEARNCVELECKRIFDELSKMKIGIQGKKVLPPQKY